jgi:hypothetical protein
MELRLPANYSDLTLRHLQVLETTDDPIKRVQVVTGKPFAELRKMPQALLVEAAAHIDSLLAREVSKHEPILTLGGKEYGFIPDWEKFSAGEWIDMETYTKDFWKTAHKAMSVLYRPITQKWGDKYTVAEYTAQEDATPFLDMPAPAVAGALLFFWTTERELLSTLESSLTTKAVQAIRSIQSGNGTPPSTHWLGRTFSKLTRSLASRWATSSRTSHS